MTLTTSFDGPTAVMDVPLDALDPTDAAADAAIIDDALQLICGEQHRMASRMIAGSGAPLSLEQVRDGPLGQDLRRLVAIARGQAQAPGAQVLAALESVLALLFWPAAGEDYQAPRSFWETGLGRLLAMAKYRSFEPAELVGIGVAANRLGVARPTVYRWIDDRTLDAVRDDASGRTFVVQRGLDDMRRDLDEVRRAAGGLAVPH